MLTWIDRLNTKHKNASIKQITQSRLNPSSSSNNTIRKNPWYCKCKLPPWLSKTLDDQANTICELCGERSQSSHKLCVQSKLVQHQTHVDRTENVKLKAGKSGWLGARPVGSQDYGSCSLLEMELDQYPRLFTHISSTTNAKKIKPFSTWANALGKKRNKTNTQKTKLVCWGSVPYL